MRSIVAFLTLAILLNAEANGQEVKFGPVPTWANHSEALPVPDSVQGPFFVRRQDVQVHLDSVGQKNYSATLWRLLDQNALQLGNVAIAWNPSAGAPVVHAIKVHRNGTSRDVLTATKFEILRREDGLETAMLDGTLTAILRVPDLRIGDDLEIAYTIPTQDPTLGTDNGGAVFISSTPPPGKMVLRLSWEKSQEPNIRPSPDLQDQIKRDAQTVWVTFDSPPALVPPKDAPLRYSFQRMIQFSDFKTWQSVSSRVAPLFATASALNTGSEVRREAAVIAANNKDQMSRAKAALELVQQQVRYIYVGLERGNITPASAEETWQRRYGDCKGKTALLLALLQELGVTAQAVLVNNGGIDDGLDQQLPNPSWFNHVLVRATIDGKAYWLDGTLPKFYGPSAAPTMSYRWVLPVSVEGSKIEALPWAPRTKPNDLTLYEIDARAGFDTPAKTRTVTVTRGPAALAEYFRYSSVSTTQLESGFKQSLEGSSTWNSIDKVAWRFDPKELASVMEIVGTGPVDWEKEGKNSRELALPGGGFNPPDRRQRGANANPSIPFYKADNFDCRVTTVLLPRTTADKDWSYNSSFRINYFGQSFSRSFERRSGSIRMISANRSLQTEISSEVATRDNARIADFDNSMARIFHDPGSSDSIKTTEKVQATFEGDWISDPGACLTAVSGK